MLTPNRTHERLVALFLLGVLLFTPPLIALFNNATRVLGLPPLYLYLFGTWAAIIALAALAMERATPDSDPAKPAQTTPAVIGTQNAED
jgi:hypothetical protein